MFASFAATQNGLALVAAAGRTIALRKPEAGAAEVYRIASGDTLDLSQIANENITLVKLGSRLVILFADRGFVVVDGLYLGDGAPAPDIQVGLNASTVVNAAQFVAQFPISDDTQVLTAAGINVGPLGSGGVNLAAAPPGSALQPLSALTPDAEIAGQTFGALPPSSFGGASGNLFGSTPPGLPGTSSAPAAANDSAAVREAGVSPGNTPFAGSAAASGNVTANDSGAGALTVTGVQAGILPSAAGNVGAAIAGVYGALTLAADGSYTYALDNADTDTQALAQGQVVQEVFTYTVTDAGGQSATAQLSVTITGTNDVPVITSGAEAARGSVTEDGRWYEVGPPPGPFTTGGTLAAADVDAGAVLTWSGNAAGLYGDFTIDPVTGEWRYTLDEARSNGLAAGQVVTETFLAIVTDEFGATATQTVTVTINGYNDEPFIDLDTTASGRNYQGLTAAEAARSTGTLLPANGATIVQTDDAPSPAFQFAVSDPDGDTFRSIQVEIRNTASGDKGYLYVPGSVLTGAAPGSTLSASGTHPSDSDYARTIRLENGAGQLSQADLERFLREVRYINTETTFALDTSDREIRVIVVDENGADQVATAYIPVIADVRDTTGLDVFTGTRFDDRIEGMGGSDTIRAGGGDDTLIYRAGDGTDALLDGGDGTDSLDMLGTDSNDTFRVLTAGGTVDRMTSE
ncbi:MAG: VCBS domain-containing protein, partial [Hyphomicrobiales bacterium]|nr:VCBS domain-containing protein [Hyphomicrobiales bacterium]